MKAFKLARRYPRSPIPKDELARLTIQERNLLQLVLIHGELSPEQIVIRDRIDAGGVMPNRATLVQIFRGKLSAAEAAEIERPAGSDKIMMYSTTADAISSAHTCAADAGELSRVRISDLVKGAVTRGSILWGTIRAPVVTGPSVSVFFEDDTGATVSLYLYNFLPPGTRLAQAQQCFPMGTRLGVKEPYLKMSNDGYLNLRVDNPCNVVVQRAESTSLQTAAGGQPLTAAELKAQGNSRFAVQDFSGALAAYSAALALADADAQPALLSNRAAAHLGLGNNQAALVDADACLRLAPAPDLARKVRYRRGKALALLHRFDEALEVLSALVDDSARSDAPTDAALVQLHTSVSVASAQTRGTFDFLTFPFDAADQSLVGDFIGPLEVRDAGTKGRGLFTSRAVAAGELLLAERALCVAFKAASDHTSMTAMDYSDNSINPKTQHELVSRLIMLASTDPRRNAQLSLLSRGKDGAAMQAMGIPSVTAFASGDIPPTPPLSALAIRQIVKMNTFGCHRDCAKPTQASRAAVQHLFDSPLLCAPEMGPAPVNAIMRAAADPTAAAAEPHRGATATATAAAGPAVLKQLIQRTPTAQRAIDINAAEPVGRTALMYCAVRGDAACTRVLLEAGAAPDARDATGCTALLRASDVGVVAALLDAGADPNATNFRGITPLACAIAQNNGAGLDLLLRRGASPHTDTGLPERQLVSLADRVRTAALEGTRGVRGDADAELVRVLAAHHCPIDSVIEEGCGLWLVASLMNHAGTPSTKRFYVGGCLFVRAARALPAGAEVTTTYSCDADALRRTWGIC